LAEFGAVIVDTPAALADRDIVFTMVSGPDDLIEVVTGSKGVLSRPDRAPKLWSIVRACRPRLRPRSDKRAASRGVAMLAAPVSGTPKWSRPASCRWSLRPGSAVQDCRALSRAARSGVSYVGDGELARMVKICHNILLGVVTQSLAEITVLAERGGVPRTPSRLHQQECDGFVVQRNINRRPFVNLDWTPTFTP